jgi:Spy/CpxP family protein refolding chaperone
MDRIKKGKWQVRVAALVVFILGFAAGALVFTAYQRWSRNHERGGNRFEQMLNSLDLTAEQKTQVHQILVDTRQQLQNLRKESEPRFEEIRRQADERLQKVMTPEQWQNFQQKRSEMRGRGRRGGRGGPDDRP